MISILKITKGNDSAKDTISILTIYKITKWHKTKKKVAGVTVHNQSGHTFICTKFHKIISNRIKVIEWTRRYLCRKLKRGIIQQKM